jgi:hypothetical protein
MPIIADVEIDHPLAEWYCNLVWIERKKCLLFTHANTLYSFLVVDFRKGDTNNLDDIFQSHFRKSLKYLHMPNSIIDTFLPHIEGLKLAKTIDKRILGSMNDLGYQYQVNIAHIGGLKNCDMDEMIYIVNTTPMSMIKYKNGNNLMLELIHKITT